MINKKLAKQIFMDGQIIGARQMLNFIKGKQEEDITFEIYWETIFNDTEQDLDEVVLNLINKSIK